MSDVKEKSTSHEHLLRAALAHVPPEGQSPFHTRSRGEKRGVYLRRLIGVVAELSDEKFKELPEGAQDWFNRSATALNESYDAELPHLDGFDNKEEPEAKSGDAEKGVEGEAPEGEAVKGEAGSAPKPAPEAAPKAPKALKQKGVVRLVREAITLDPTMTNDQLMTYVKEHGVPDPKDTSVALCRIDMLSALRIVRDLGKLVADFPTIPGGPKVAA